MDHRAFSLLLSLLLFAHLSECKKPSIPDDLDDVLDDEEDESWKQWGRKDHRLESSLPPPPDFSKMDVSQIQAEMMKRHVGPSFGFVKLRSKTPLSREDVPEIAMRWTKVLRTGSVDAKFMAVDINTVMFTLEKGQDTEELKDFILSQPEAYEVKLGEQKFRRSGDPPLDELIRDEHHSPREDL